MAIRANIYKSIINFVLSYYITFPSICCCEMVVYVTSGAMRTREGVTIGANEVLANNPTLTERIQKIHKPGEATIIEGLLRKGYNYNQAAHMLELAQMKARGAKLDFENPPKVKVTEPGRRPKVMPYDVRGIRTEEVDHIADGLRNAGKSAAALTAREASALMLGARIRGPDLGMRLAVLPPGTVPKKIGAEEITAQGEAREAERARAFKYRVTINRGPNLPSSTFVVTTNVPPNELPRGGRAAVAEMVRRDPNADVALQTPAGPAKVVDGVAIDMNQLTGAMEMAKAYGHKVTVKQA